MSKPLLPAPKPTRKPKAPKSMKRTGPIGPNRGRRHLRFERAYKDAAYVGLVKWKGCVVGGCLIRPVHAAHRISRARGGTWQDLFGCCWLHHEEQHRIGIREFEKRYRLDLEAECARNVMEFKAFTK